MTNLHKKYYDLQARLNRDRKVVVAFSGGIDSTFLLTAAIQTLGKENVLAVLVRSQFFTKEEIDEAIDYLVSIEAAYVVVDVDVLAIDDLRKNPPNRCYVCKKNIFERIVAIAKREGIDAVYEGSNLDDLGDYRPGRKAVQELGVASPLLDASLSKQDIRDLACELGIPNWDRPSSPCLATRFVFGEEISQDRLNMVEAAERIISDLGFKQIRVRTHGQGSSPLARIELGRDDLEKLNGDEALQHKIICEIEGLGYSKVEIDEKGYRRGSMNEV